MTIINEICDAISRNPKINRVVVSQAELVAIRAELYDLTPVKRGPRPTYGGPWGDIDRQLWDDLEYHMKHVAPVQIIGRKVIARTTV